MTDATGALLELYGTVWPFVPPGIERARGWGAEWFEVSTAHTIRHGGQLVAHAGVIECELALGGAPCSVTALHAVCVHPDFRGEGLGRAVVETALESIDAAGRERVILWSEKVEFYAKFGFRPWRESAFQIEAPRAVATDATACDPDRPEDLARLHAAFRARRPVSAGLAAADSGWHFLINLGLWSEAVGSPPRERLAILADGVVLAYALGSDQLELHDVIGARLPSLSEIVGAVESIEGKRVGKVRFGFTPDRLAPGATPCASDDEDVLMIRGAPLSPEDAPFALSPYSRT